MRTYAFRIQCKLAGGDPGTSEREFSLVLQTPIPPISVNLPKQGHLSEDQFLILRCGSFTSEAAAHAEGMRVKTAVMLAGVLRSFGVDVGTDQVISPAAQGRDGQPDEHFQPDVHGLQVVPEIEGIYFGQFARILEARLVRKDFPKDFRQSVADSYSLNKALTKKQTLAAQLYNQSHFHLSDTARFLTLTSAIEALADQRSKSPATVALIDRMMEMSAAARNPDDLNNGLGNLKQESIRSACRRLVETYCEPAVVTWAARAFARAYKIRSTLLHEGEPPLGTDLAAELRTLDLLVRHLIMRHVAFS